LNKEPLNRPSAKNAILKMPDFVKKLKIEDDIIDEALFEKQIVSSLLQSPKFINQKGI
jgi:hypothetical protein